MSKNNVIPFEKCKRPGEIALNPITTASWSEEAKKAYRHLYREDGPLSKICARVAARRAASEENNNNNSG